MLETTDGLPDLGFHKNTHKKTPVTVTIVIRYSGSAHNHSNYGRQSISTTDQHFSCDSAFLEATTFAMQRRQLTISVNKGTILRHVIM
eukprot:m.941444 g.941444  ORF g.941444 m.941444 type:complete len:88 (+) comp23833_c1_seq5:600-863(+)